MYLQGRSFLFLVTCLLCFSCTGQNGKQKNIMDDLFKQELKNQDIAQYGNKNPAIQVISDPKEVARLQKQIEEKQRLQIKMNDKEGKKTSLAEAYKSGDRSVVPAIIGILKGNDKSRKEELLDQLVTNSEDPAGYTINDKEIIDLILLNIDNPVYEKAAVQLAGFNKLPGYENKFESRLFSGKSTDAGRILFWLGRKGQSPKVFDYIVRQVKENKIDRKELDNIIWALESYGEKGNPEIKSLVGNIALDIYRKKLITDNDIEELKESAYTSDGAEGLLRCLFEYGNKDVVPIAKDVLARGIRITGPLEALIKLEGPQHIEKVYQYLKNEEQFYTGLDLVEGIDRKYVDDKMLKEVLVQFGKRKDITDFQVERIVRAFKRLKADNYINNSATIIDGKVADQLKRAYALSSFSSSDVLTDLKNKGLVATMPDSVTIRKALENAENNPVSFISEILASQNLYISFDAETDMLPVNYDELLKEFAGKSDGVLKDMIVWLDAKEIPANKYSYVITVIYKDNAFITKPEDIGDWYQIETVNALINKLLERSGSPKRFNFMETGDQTVQYIFGVPSVVEEVLKKYKL